MRTPLICLLSAALLAAAETDDAEWEQHYARALEKVAIPELKALLLYRPAAWPRAHASLTRLLERAPDDARRKELIGLLLTDPDARRRRDLDRLVVQHPGAFETLWILRLAEEGGAHSARHLKRRLADGERDGDLVLPAAWLAWAGDAVGQEQLLRAASDQKLLEESPSAVLAAALAAKRLLRTPGPWLEARARMAELARKRLSAKRLNDARRLLAHLEYAPRIEASADLTFFDLDRQVTRTLNLKRAEWESAEAIADALRAVERS